MSFVVEVPKNRVGWRVLWTLLWKIECIARNVTFWSQIIFWCYSVIATLSMMLRGRLVAIGRSKTYGLFKCYWEVDVDPMGEQICVESMGWASVCPTKLFRSCRCLAFLASFESYCCCIALAFCDYLALLFILYRKLDGMEYMNVIGYRYFNVSSSVGVIVAALC
jgi:hypothetical protein